jgi:hypothetical protein
MRGTIDRPGDRGLHQAGTGAARRPRGWRVGSATVGLLLGVLLVRPVAAGEADDLQAMIDRAKNGVEDLERLDEKGVATEDATVLRMWLEEAWRLRSEQKYDDVRIVLDRGDAQAEMIRQKIQAAKLAAQAADREQKLAALKADIEKTRKAIDQARIQKAALEAKTK